MIPALAVLVIAALLSGSAIAAAGSEGQGTARSGAEILEDSAITVKVKMALRADAAVDSRDIEVRTHRRVVQLSGRVGSQRQIDRAGEVTAAVEGVRRVTNGLVHKPMEMARSRPACKPAGPCSR